MPINLQIYNRTISVTRQSVPIQTGGPVAYGGDQPVNDATILSGIAAGIQSDRLGRSTPSNLPSASQLPMYRIFIPAKCAALGTINKNDTVIDDIGIRYRVSDPYRTRLGYELRAEMMAM